MTLHNFGREKGTGTICAQHPPGRSGKWCLSPFSPLRFSKILLDKILRPE